MTVEQLSPNELTLLSSLIKQNDNKLNRVIIGAKKLNDVRTERLIEMVELAKKLRN
jgi:succinate dehydrogenase flavin-adding protein (antitoxin of CptAB toxin-antitoxin module)